MQQIARQTSHKTIHVIVNFTIFQHRNWWRAKCVPWSLLATKECDNTKVLQFLVHVDCRIGHNKHPNADCKIRHYFWQENTKDYTVQMVWGQGWNGSKCLKLSNQNIFKSNANSNGADSIRYIFICFQRNIIEKCSYGDWLLLTRCLNNMPVILRSPFIDLLDKELVV